MKFIKSYFILFAIILFGLTFLSACGNTNANPTSVSTPSSLFPNEDVPPPPPLDPQRVTQGQELYDQYCAECHGTTGEGQPDWKIPNDDGSYKPPPHDAGGHTWHHGDDLLPDLIANGSDFPQTKMPTYGDKLSDEEILAIVEYLKSWWGPEERAFQWQMTWQAQQQK